MNLLCDLSVTEQQNEALAGGCDAGKTRVIHCSRNGTGVITRNIQLSEASHFGFDSLCAIFVLSRQRTPDTAGVFQQKCNARKRLYGRNL
jgi:hypothetical protein